MQLRMRGPPRQGKQNAKVNTVDGMLESHVLEAVSRGSMYIMVQVSKSTCLSCTSIIRNLEQLVAKTLQQTRDSY